MNPWAVAAELDQLVQLDLWPGFEPSKVPLALFDGHRTFLFRHPKPPSQFQELEGNVRVYVYEGQHPEVRANTSVLLEGIQTATLLLDERHSVEELVATLLHETFHVFQRERHPDWCANEAELFVYPVEDVEVLRTRWLEAEALRRALSEGDPQKAAGWAVTALKARNERFQRLPEGSVAYERGTELNEGLAQYIEGLARGKRGSPLPDGEFPAEEVRRRAYAVGHALAQLLDRFDPEWKRKLESEEAKSLDELLAAALDRMSTRPQPFSERDVEAALAWAQAEAERVEAERKALREGLLRQPGYRVVVEAQGEPLWLQGFDPMNVRRLSTKEVLHTRWLKLGNKQGTLEVLDRSCLTEAAGDHPLFQGVRRAILTGFSAKPEAAEKGDRIRLRAKGLNAEFLQARLRRAQNSIMVHLR